MPKYLHLANKLGEKINSLNFGELLPTEHELMDDYDVSRVTAREALRELEVRHLVRRERGSGTRVALRLPYPIKDGEAPSWSQLVRDAGHVATRKVAEITRGTPPEVVAKELIISKSKHVTKISRMGLVNNEVATYQEHWLIESPKNLEESMNNGESLTYFLQQHLGYRIVRNWSRVDLIPAPIGVAKALQLIGQPPVWHIKSVNGCAKLRKPVEYSESFMRADAFHVYLEFGETQKSIGEL